MDDPEEIDVVQSNRKMPLARRPWPIPEGPSGIRPSVSTLVGQIDQSEPAFIFIAAELQRIRRIGDELDDAAIVQAVAEGRRKHDQYLKNEEARRPGRIPSSIVYYVRRGAFIKIGTTTRPHQRFADLLPDEILAWEPGGRPEEAQRHEQFKDMRVSTSAEYFRRSPALDAHVADIRVAHGAPDPTWRTMTNLAQRPNRARLPELPVTPHLVTLEEGTRQLGIRLGTARVWIHRGKLRHILESRNGTKLYFLCDLRSLSRGGRTGHRDGRDLTD